MKAPDTRLRELIYAIPTFVTSPASRRKHTSVPATRPMRQSHRNHGNAMPSGGPAYPRMLSGPFERTMPRMLNQAAAPASAIAAT
jgi:hypothetical protein